MVNRVVYSASQILDRFCVNLNWCHFGNRFALFPFPPPLYTIPLAFDSLMIGASGLGCKTGNTHVIRYSTPDHLCRLVSKDAATADRSYLIVRQKRSIKMLSRARPFPSMLIFISLSIKGLINEWLVNWLP